jgi:predicted porin
MNKKLIAAAVAAGLAAPMMAHADVTVYGLAQLELANVDPGVGDSATVVADSKNSRIGVKWSEDLGQGLKAIGEFEWGPDALGAATSTDSCSTTATVGTTTVAGTCKVTDKDGIYARQAWLGLKGGWGEFQVGTVLQPYKYSGGVKYDAFVATGAEARSGNGGMLGTHFGQNGYFAQALAYKNKFGNVQFWIAYSPAEVSDANHVYKGSKGDLNASVVVGLGAGEVGVAYAKDNYKTGTTGTEGEKNTKIFGKYSFGNSTVLAQYEQSDVVAAGGDLKIAFLAYRLKMGKNMLAVQLGQTDIDTGNDTKYVALGVRHSFSKKTSAFLAYRNTDEDNGDANDVKVITLGLTEKF